jgi:C1A family cysteine protease
MNQYHSLSPAKHAMGHRPPPENHPLKLSSPFSHQILKTDAPLPLTVDLRPQLLPVRNQMDIGACSAFSSVGFREQLHYKRCGQLLPGYLAPNYLYWRTRLLENSFPTDSGASIADEMSTLTSWGVCPESAFPFVDTCNVPGTPQDDTLAAEFKLKTQPLQVDWSDMTNFETVLALGISIVIGFTVYASFEDTPSSGIVPPPSGGVVGGHGVQIVGYDHNAQTLLLRNQWTDQWADQGYCYPSYSYMQQVLSEAWTVAG